jgi:ATP-dependent Lon protease
MTTDTITEIDLPVDQEVMDLIEEAVAADSDDELSPEDQTPTELNILPLRDSVIFPMLIAPLSVGRPASVQLIDESFLNSNRLVGIVAQRDSATDEPLGEEVYPVGCAVIIRNLTKTPEGVRLIVQGTNRFRILQFVQEKPFLRAKIEILPEEPVLVEDTEEVEALRRSVAALFDQAVRLSPALPDEMRSLTQNVTEAHVMADLVAAHIPLALTEKQLLLEAVDLKARLRNLLEFMGREVRVLELTSKVQSEVSQELSKTQRDYYLREQLKAIQRELGEGDDPVAELDDLHDKVLEAEMPDEAFTAASRELSRLGRINVSSPEYTVARTYVETMASVPWAKSSLDNLDLTHVREVLDQDHYGLDDIKKRIIEFLAVRKLKKDGPVRQPILCFYGPPGVGKTSLGRSIARAMEREFVRFSVGGVRDEAEIRGHRRTYIGALPGQIVQGLRRAGTNNPVFVLDEIDKLANDFRGDPASALLEVLDPQQNNSFRDHYLDVPLDLSNVFFVTTANRLDTIQSALRDRMEIIELGSYTEDEKVAIARQHLLPRQLEEHGLPAEKVVVTEGALHLLVRGYTRESGVRNLERELAGVLRKVAVNFAEGKRRKVEVNERFVRNALGAERFSHDIITERELIPGVAVGLAWTPVGGDILFIETTQFPGSGLVVTGQLGDVMRESVTAALSYIRSRSHELKLSPEVFEKNQIHVHVPAASVPKDGPSAGITMLTALTSLLTGKRVKPRLAMTGEVTLTGQVLPIGGVKEKVLAAYRSGVTEVILPDENKKDWNEDVPANVKQAVKVHFVKNAKQVLRLALEA